MGRSVRALREEVDRRRADRVALRVGGERRGGWEGPNVNLAIGWILLVAFVACFWAVVYYSVAKLVG